MSLKVVNLNGILFGELFPSSPSCVCIWRVNNSRRNGPFQELMPLPLSMRLLVCVACVVGIYGVNGSDSDYSGGNVEVSFLFTFCCCCLSQFFLFIYLFCIYCRHRWSLVSLLGAKIREII